MSTSFHLNRSILVSSLRTGKLDLHGLSLTRLPHDLFVTPRLCETLHTLDLSHNKLTSLKLFSTGEEEAEVDADWSRFVSLKYVYVDDNQLTALPAEWSRLPLRVVSLDNNPLPALLMAAYQTSKRVAEHGHEAGPVLAELRRQERESGRGEILASIAADRGALPTQSGHSRVSSKTKTSVTASSSSSPTSSGSGRSGVVTRLPLASAVAMNEHEPYQSESSKSKQAALSSRLFTQDGQNQTNASQSEVLGQKKHSDRAHQPSHVFSIAQDSVPSFSQKRLGLQKVDGQKPFGTDDQVQIMKERRLGEESEKENSATTLPYIGGPSQDGYKQNTGKKVASKGPSMAPFGMIDSSFGIGETISTAHRQQQIDPRHPQVEEARAALEKLGLANKPLAAAGTSATHEHDMKGLLSGENSDDSGPNSPRYRTGGLKITQRPATNIFAPEATESRPMSSRSHRSSPSLRDTSPWSTESVALPVRSISTSQVFGNNSVSETVSRFGRGRNAPQPRDNGIFG